MSTALRKKLHVVGSSRGIIIDKPILQMLGISNSTELEITTDGKRIIIEPVETSPVVEAQQERQQKLDAALEAVLAAHHETFRKLSQ